MTVRELFAVINTDNREITITRDYDDVWNQEPALSHKKCDFLECDIDWIWEISPKRIRIKIK